MGIGCRGVRAVAEVDPLLPTKILGVEHNNPHASHLGVDKEIAGGSARRAGCLAIGETVILLTLSLHRY
jgi:hypothetical protein